MTIDNQPEVPAYAVAPAPVPNYAVPPPYSAPVAQQPNYSYPEYSQQRQATIVRTQRAGGSGLLTIGIIFWLVSFFFMYDSGLFWTLQIISYAVCCTGSIVTYSGARRYRTYLVHTEPQYVYAQPQPVASYPAPPSSPSYV